MSGCLGLSKSNNPELSPDVSPRSGFQIAPVKAVIPDQMSNFSLSGSSNNTCGLEGSGKIQGDTVGKTSRSRKTEVLSQCNKARC